MNIWLLFLSAAQFRKYWVRELRGGWSFMPITHGVQKPNSPKLVNFSPWTFTNLSQGQSLKDSSSYSADFQTHKCFSSLRYLAWDLLESKVTRLSCSYMLNIFSCQHFLQTTIFAKNWLHCVNFCWITITYKTSKNNKCVTKNISLSNLIGNKLTSFMRVRKFVNEKF